MGNPNTSWLRRLKGNLTQALLRQRWLLLILLAASAIIFEILEHQYVDDPIDAHFIREILFFGIVYPIAAGLLLDALLKIQAERNADLRRQELEQRLNRELLAASNWEELRLKVVYFLAAILPVTGVSLFTFSEGSNNLKFETEWRLMTAEAGRVPQAIPYDHCGVSSHGHVKHFHAFVPGAQSVPAHSKGYCLPLFHRDQWVGAMHLHLPVSDSLTIEQINNLNTLSSTIALAIQSAMLGSSITLQSEAIQNERKRIARELHDTLGQNLAYLRLMLDKMTMNGSIQEVATIQRELEQMRDIANEAHKQIRNTLSMLRPDAAANLADLLQATAGEVAQVADFKLQFVVLGEPESLPPIIQQKIHAIFREALYNVQRHAQAKTVQLSINWNVIDRTLLISLTDDGVGFEMEHIPQQGHFGLLIMHQRAEEIGAELTITSAPVKGTQVRLGWPAN